MRRVFSQNNPFIKIPRFALGYELINDNTKILDYGCHDGSFGYMLKKYRNVDYVGVDKNIDAILRAPEGILIKELTYPLPFNDEEFDAITMFEVLEHIHDQNKVLTEIFRIMKPNGLLLVSVPRKHIFSFLDLANWKFIFPTIHRYYYTFIRSSQAYEERYLNNQNGLVGDIEKEKCWHQQFSDKQMIELLENNKFKIEEVDGFGLFNLPIVLMSYIFHLSFLFPQSLRDWDNRCFHYSSLLCAARK
jgi:SAM-dependent methyltransferase